MAEGKCRASPNELAKTHGGDIDAIRGEIQASTRQELMDRYGVACVTTESWARRYGTKLLKQSQRPRPCTDCGAGRGDADFRKGRRICRRCESIRKTGGRPPCSACGADLFGEPSAATHCTSCISDRQAFLKARRKRREVWRLMLRRGTFGGSFVDYLQERRCPLAQWVASQWIPVRVLFPRARALNRKYPAELYSLSKAEQFKWRYHNDPEFNLKQRLRSSARKHRRFGCLNTRIRNSIFYPTRNRDMFDLLGYSPRGLRLHIERQFTRGMTWERFAAGEIHIDHVRPLKLFDLEDPAQVIAAWALPNLQPLWARDNLKKASKSTKLV